MENRVYQSNLGTLNVRTTHKPEHILVQHNEEAISEIAASMLNWAGYECRQAASPMEALEIIGSGEEFDLLLC
jgi:CheY-like chemotaxis protein